MKILPTKIKNILKSRTIMKKKNVFILMLLKPIPAGFAMIFFNNFLVHLYSFKLQVVFFVISINDFTIYPSLTCD